MSWRAVIYLNLIRNVVEVLDVLVQAMSQADSDRAHGPGFSDSDEEHRRHPSAFTFTDKHRLLKIRLAPLRSVLVDLEKRLGPGSQEIYSVSLPPAGPSRSREFAVCSSNGWKSVLDKIRLTTTRKGTTSPTSAQKQRDLDHDEVTDILAGCRQDMKNLWEDPVVKQVLAYRRSKIEDSSGLCALSDHLFRRRAHHPPKQLSTRHRPHRRA